MPLPKYDELYEPFLRAVADGAEHKKKDVCGRIAADLDLTAEDLGERLPSGKQTVFDNRVGWASTHLKKAGLIVSSSRAAYAITPEGKKALNSGISIDNDYLKRYPSFVQFRNLGVPRDPLERKTVSRESPEEPPKETLEKAYKTLSDALANDLLDEVMKLSPQEFESLVLKLLQKMGYGSGIEDSTSTTPFTHDQGIDGIVKEDRLGFSSIYVQAKQWDPDKGTIGSPEVQKFAGALQAQKGQKGLFITTGTFTKGARDYVDKINSTIVLIDGGQLTRLMIRYNLGVSVEFTYEIKRVDSDFFDDIV